MVVKTEKIDCMRARKVLLPLLFFIAKKMGNQQPRPEQGKVQRLSPLWGVGLQAIGNPKNID